MFRQYFVKSAFPDIFAAAKFRIAFTRYIQTSCNSIVCAVYCIAR